MADTGLPQGWEILHSESRNLPYYYNQETGASEWTPPEGTDLDQLKRYHQENRAPKEDGKVRASHLLIKHKDSRRPSSWRQADITRTKEEALSTILGHEARIRSGAATLGEIAATESDCSSAKRQGDLGYFGRGQMQKSFETATFGLKVGELSRVVETNSGWHLIERTG